MTPFNAHHIKQFNQRCKHLTGEGKVVFTHKELRDLQAELLDLMLHVKELEESVADLKTKASQNAEINVELIGKPFK